MIWPSSNDALQADDGAAYGARFASGLALAQQLISGTSEFDLHFVIHRRHSEILNPTSLNRPRPEHRSHENHRNISVAQYTPNYCRSRSILSVR